MRLTHSSKIRMEAIKCVRYSLKGHEYSQSKNYRQREQKLFEERHKSEKFWEERKDEMDLSRLKLLSSLGSYSNIQEEIERKIAEKR